MFHHVIGTIQLIIQVRTVVGTLLQLLAQRVYILYRGFAPPVVYICFGWPATRKRDVHLLTLNCYSYGRGTENRTLINRLKAYYFSR